MSGCNEKRPFSWLGELLGLPRGIFRFPQWVNRVGPLVAVLLAAVPVYAVVLVYYAGAPTTTDIGYSPKQPVAFSHLQHAGQLDIDCRYCHTTVETAAFAAVPPTSVCMNCHETIAPESEKLALVRESATTADPMHWIRVHDLPDYVYFNHSAHLNGGVGCVSCHGRVDTMDQVRQVHTLSMGWCLDCHRDPAPHLREAEYLTNMQWNQGSRRLGERLIKERGISPSTDCSTCHR